MGGQTGLHDFIEVGVSNVQGQLEAQHRISSQQVKLGARTEPLERSSLRSPVLPHSSPCAALPTPLWLLQIHSQLAKLQSPESHPTPLAFSLTPDPALTSSSEGPRRSKVRDCMREKRTPSSRWTPEHWMQVSTPRLVLSQVGSAGERGAQLKPPAQSPFSTPPTLPPNLPHH